MFGTVIGALKRNLGISVKDLAQHKDLDLRVHFSCWLSKPVQKDNCPFNRILCFEKKRAGK